MPVSSSKRNQASPTVSSSVAPPPSSRIGGVDARRRRYRTVKGQQVVGNALAESISAVAVADVRQGAESSAAGSETVDPPVAAAVLSQVTSATSATALSEIASADVANVLVAALPLLGPSGIMEELSSSTAVPPRKTVKKKRRQRPANLTRVQPFSFSTTRRRARAGVAVDLSSVQSGLELMTLVPPRSYMASRPGRIITRPESISADASVVVEIRSTSPSNQAACSAAESTDEQPTLDRPVSVSPFARHRSRSGDDTRSPENRHVTFASSGRVEVHQFSVDRFQPSTTRGPRRVFGGDMSPRMLPSPFGQQRISPAAVAPAVLPTRLPGLQPSAAISSEPRLSSSLSRPTIRDLGSPASEDAAS